MVGRVLIPVDCPVSHAEILYYRLQYREAKLLLADVNRNRPCKEPYYRHCLNTIAFACFAPVRLLDWLRISRFGHFLVRKGLVQDRSLLDCYSEHVFARASNLRREDRAKAQVEDASMAWTMSMAFYALSGGCIYTREIGGRIRTSEPGINNYFSEAGEQRVLRRDAIAYLAAHEPQSLLQLQRVVLQNPGKANAMGKTITCVQAMWFCTQCIARLSGNLAVSLLELNTFAHCISTLLIYIFWWDKPYDVEAHTLVESKSLDFGCLLHLSLFKRAGLAPGVFVPYESDPVQQGSLKYYIFDSHGNHLINAYPHVLTISKDELLVQSKDNPSFAQFGLGSRMRMCDMELCISFESSGIISAPTYRRPTYRRLADDEPWKRFESLWIKSGRPLPAYSVSQTERWFYRRTTRSPDLDADLVEQITRQVRPMMCVIMTFTFMVYGGLHLLAWRYNFRSRSERYLWRISAVTTASTGLVLLNLYVAGAIRAKTLFFRRTSTIARFGNSKAEQLFYVGLQSLSCLLFVFNVVARAFLVIESFIALPNSPRSTYTIPNWAAYIPHI